MAGAWSAASLWQTVRSCLTAALVGLTIADRYARFVTVDGHSMLPTFDPEPGDRALVERLCLDRYDFSRGDVVVFRSPEDHRTMLIKRLIALPGDWIQVPEAREIRQIPEGHCWVEGDNAGNSWDSRVHGPNHTHFVAVSSLTDGENIRRQRRAHCQSRNLPLVVREGRRQRVHRRRHPQPVRLPHHAARPLHAPHLRPRGRLRGDGAAIGSRSRGRGRFGRSRRGTAGWKETMLATVWTRGTMDLFLWV